MTDDKVTAAELDGDAFEAGDVTWQDIARNVSEIYTKERGEWCGLPIPVEGVPLEVEPNHPHREMLAQLSAIWDEAPTDPEPVTEAPDDPDDDPDGWTIVNQWRGHNRNGVTGEVIIERHTDGRTRWGLIPDGLARFKRLQDSFIALDVWSAETELVALGRLKTLVTERQFASYLFTGMFLEQSRRSRVAYFFRRLAPTLALGFHADTKTYHPIAALCLHPIAYYVGTPCGAMVPTDDVIAHLMMMRADEHMFWRRANQHDPFDPRGGI